MKGSIGPYRIERLIGAGAASAVYLAEEKGVSRRVALKVLHQRLTSEPVHVERFRREAEWIATLKHPNIVEFYAFGEVDGMHYIATEYVKGETLRTQVLSKLPIERVVAIGKGMAGALGIAHESWIVHRDVKPENVMIREDGEVKFLDFGLAKLTRKDIGASRALTKPGSVVGTLNYIAPEQLVGSAADPRCDVFGLGCVLYELIMGAPPFDGSTAREIVEAILHKDPPPLRRVEAEIPRDLVDIVERAINKDPEMRYQSASEVLHELDRVSFPTKPNG